MTKKLVIELELKDGGLLFQTRPDMVAAGYKFQPEELARTWIGYYLDGGGEQDWLNSFDIWGVPTPDEAYCGELRVVEVTEDGKRLVRWDWRGKPQVPETDEAALLRGVENDLDALTEEQRMDIFHRYCKHCGIKDPKCRCWDDE